MRALACLGFSLLALSAAAAGPDDWPSWRGPDGSCSVDDGRDYPVRFGPDENVRWKAELPGVGCSTPIVQNGRVFVTCPVGGQDAVLCYDLDAGRQLWATPLGPETPGKHRNASGCNPSPVTDGERVYAYFKSGTLACLDPAGQVVWRANLQDAYGPSRLYWDLGTSPVLTGRDVVAAVMHEGESFLAALEKSSGELSWKVGRTYETPRECDQSYATPVVTRQNGEEVILVWGAEHVTCHRAEDGGKVWECGGFNPERKELWPACASMVLAGDVAVVPYGRGSELTGVRVGGKGDVTATHRAWVAQDNCGFVPTPAVYEGRVYILRDGGEVLCLDPATGKTLWGERLPKGRAKYYASPVIAGGKLYAAREDGALMVAAVEGGWKLLAENDMGERLIATPVPAGGRLLVRGEEHLYCIGR